MAETDAAQPQEAIPQPTAPIGPNRVGILQTSGFSDADISAWSQQRRDILSTAGYSNEDIDHYLTGVKVPQQPAGLFNRITQTAGNDALAVWGFVKKHAGIIGQGFLNVSREGLEAQEQFQQGIDPYTGKAATTGYERAETLAKFVAPLVLGPATTATGGALERAAAAPRTTVPEAVKTGEALEGTFPLSRVEPMQDGSTVEHPIGAMPQAQDFLDATKAISGETANTNVPSGGVGTVVSIRDRTRPELNAAERTAEIARLSENGLISREGGEWLTMMNNEGTLARISKDEFYSLIDKYSAKEKPAVEVGPTALGAPANDVGQNVTGKFLTLYNEKGIHPAEVVHDAQTDVTVTQSMLSDGKDFPTLYGEVLPAEERGGGAPPEPPGPPGEIPPPEPQKAIEGPPPTVGDAQKRILDKINIGGVDPTRKLTWDRLYTNLLDQYFPISKATKEAEKTIGPLPTWENPYELVRLFAGSAGKADHMLNHGMFNFDNYEAVGPSLKDILAPGKDNLNGLRAFGASVRALELEKRGITSGFDPDAARMVVQDGIEKYGPTMAKLINYQNQLSAYLRDSGVLSSEGYEAMLKANRLYIPFSRIMGDEPVSAAGFGKGGTLQAKNPIERITGSERDIIDPIETIIRNTYTYTQQAEKNAVGTALVDMLQRASQMPEYERSLIPRDISSAPEIKLLPGTTDTATDHAITQYLGERGIEAPEDFIAYIRTSGEQLGDDEIRILRNGKPETYQVDADLARAMKGLDRQSANMLTKILSPFTQGIRAGAVLTPEFWGRHIFRDFMYAFTTYRNGVFNPIDMVKGIMGLARKDQDFQDWLKAGGSNISFVSLDRQYLQNSIDKLADTGLLERAWNVIGNPEISAVRKAGAVATLPFKAAQKFLLDPLRMATEFAENASHLGAFKKSLRGIEKESEGVGKPEIQTAGWISRDVAVDAARMGASVRAWNAISAFANITLQDTDRVVRAFKDNPVGTGIKVAAGITLPSILLWGANHRDEATAQRYNEVPQWERDLFWIVMGNDHIYRIPKPWGMGLVFGSGVERTLDSMVADKPDAFRELPKSFMSVAVPGVVPNAFQPVIDQWANRSLFTNRTLIPSRLEKQLPEYQYTPYTTETAKELGKLIAAFPGVREASVDPANLLNGVAKALTSPILMENYLRAWTGNLGNYALTIADAGLRKAGVVPDPPLPTSTLADIPIIRAFVVRYPTATAQSIQDFEDQYDRNKTYYDTWMAKAKEGDAEAVLRVQQAGGPQMFIRLDAIQKTLNEHNQLIRDIYKDPTTPSDEKRQLIDQLYYSMIQIGQAGKAAMRQVDQSMGQ